jgi:hypothetical protein
MKVTIMRKFIIASCVAALMCVALPVLSADTASDAAQVKLQTTSIPKLLSVSASVAGYKTKDLELKTTAHQITLTVVNSQLNTKLAADRESEATKMVTAIENVMIDKPEFAKVAAIHVDYIDRQGKKSKTIQGIDFFQTPARTFILHKT